MAYSKLKRINIPNIIAIPMLVIVIFSFQYLYSPETASVEKQYKADSHVIMRRTALEKNFDAYLKSKLGYGSLRQNEIGQNILPSQVLDGRYLVKGILFCGKCLIINLITCLSHLNVKC